VREANKALRFIPFQLKYSVGQRRRAARPPYNLVGPGSTVIQVGAPFDTLEAGRSRALHLALRTRNGGKVLIVEPSEESCLQLRRRIDQQELHHVTIHHGGAWSEDTTLTLFSDPEHPATNFTGGTVDYDKARIADFEQVSIPALSIPSLCEKYGLNEVDLLSVTVNGAEEDIVRGAASLLPGRIRYISLAGVDSDYEPFMAEYGYVFHSHDDRGFNFERS